MGDSILDGEPEPKSTWGYYIGTKFRYRFYEITEETDCAFFMKACWKNQINVVFGIRAKTKFDNDPFKPFGCWRIKKQEHSLIGAGL